uniref:uncharacterized protein LOC100186294 isoform X2 n=1 Tax=Ciona intestinalis TaxID=7719 RepID=UPI000EF4C7B8|nr:uncharacterized protein LOC100186294 isoform X2 [Ciona intestinalis]|eukprot:XP_026696061.1 uncharacterized protein LOC100186294 isoform X2 [Ciona intestinalis]
MSDRDQNLKRKMSTGGRNIPGLTEPPPKLSKNAKKRQRKKEKALKAEKEETKLNIDAANKKSESNDVVDDNGGKNEKEVKEKTGQSCPTNARSSSKDNLNGRGTSYDRSGGDKEKEGSVAKSGRSRSRDRSSSNSLKERKSKEREREGEKDGKKGYNENKGSSSHSEDKRRDSSADGRHWHKGGSSSRNRSGERGRDGYHGGGGGGARQNHQRVQGRDYRQQQGHYGGQQNHNQQPQNYQRGGGYGGRQQHQRVQGGDYKQQGQHGGYQQRGHGYSGRGNNMNRGGGYAQSNWQGQMVNYVASGQPMVQHDKPYGPQPPSQYEPQYTEFDVSKELVRIVRHGKYNQQIQMDAEGYVFVNDILTCKRFYDQFPGVNELYIEKIVESNDKKRFELKFEEGVGWKIKAAQGHTVKIENRSLRPITNPAEFPVVIHGTYWENWEFIKVNGLNRMGRNHIHFAPGLPNEVVSGMRKSCEVAIYINMTQALKDGFKFFQSSNQVILTEGDEKGRIHPKYFLKVVQLYPRKGIKFEIPPEYSDEKSKSNEENKSEKPKQVKGN